MCIAFAPVLECFLVCPGELADDQVIHFTGYDVKNILTYHGIPLDQHVFYSGTLPEYKMLFRKIIRELQQCKYGYLLNNYYKKTMKLENSYLNKGDVKSSEKASSQS